MDSFQHASEAGTPAALAGPAGGLIAGIAVALVVVGALLVGARRRRRGIASAQAAGRARAFDLANDILCVSGFDGRLRDVNPQAQRILGYDAEQLCVTDIREILHADDLPRALRAWRRLREGHEVRDLETRVRCRDGTWRWLSSDSVACPDSRRIYSVARDVTQEKTERRATARLRETATRLSRRLQADQLASELTHALRQPLTIIVNNVSAAARYLEGGPDNREKVKDSIARGVDEALRASDVVERLRRMCRGKSMELDLVDVNEVVKYAHALVEACATGDEPPIDLVLADGLPRIHADATLLAQVVVNLVDNAREALPCGDEPVRVRTSATGDGGVEICVRDRGPGLSVEIADRLFEPFVSTKADRLGLGLAASQRIVEGHGGEIRAEAEPNGGVAFKVVVGGGPVAGGA